MTDLAPTIYAEVQWDQRRGELLLSASTGFSGDRRNITVAVDDREQASAKWREWITLYRQSGARVVTHSRTYEPTESVDR